jgi:DNA-binding NtrC family response regulator
MPVANLVKRLRDSQGLANLVGEAPAFVAAILQIPVMARSERTVMISGETGTGKEIVARAIHYLSDRAPYPFVPVNCGSLPDTLLEAELFGHEAGAFTDARGRRAGLIEEAERGTLFLDEVDQLSYRAQVALLRVLQDKFFRPLGSAEERQANVRFLAASNASLTEVVRSRAFRADLYYRLSVFEVVLPALRERRTDILLLAEHFVQKHSSPHKLPLNFSAAAQRALLASDWPGNVRELENAVIRSIEFCEGDSIEVADLGLKAGVSSDYETLKVNDSIAPTEAGTFRELKKRTIDAFERQYLTKLMTDQRGNVARASRISGKERRDLGKLLKKHSINPKAFSSA